MVDSSENGGMVFRPYEVDVEHLSASMGSLH